MFSGLGQRKKTKKKLFSVQRCENTPLEVLRGNNYLLLGLPVMCSVPPSPPCLPCASLLPSSTSRFPGHGEGLWHSWLPLARQGLPLQSTGTPRERQGKRIKAWGSCWGPSTGTKAGAGAVSPQCPFTGRDLRS